MQYHYYLIIDLEATCCNQGTISRDDMEIIEIGAVIVDVDSLEMVDDFSIFIRPIIHPNLTEFCKKLTTITQEEIDRGVGFIEGMKIFVSWFSQYEKALFCSWGEYDKNQFKKDCRLHGMKYPFGLEHLNIKKAFAKKQGVKPCGLDKALEIVNLELLGTHHRGVDDARNMARLMPFIVEG